MPFIGNKPSAVPLTSADIADGIITSAKIADGTIVNADINASAAIASTKLTGVNDAKAWVNFNGTGTIAIRASFNVSSLTDDGTGAYTINFTNALTDKNFASSINVSDDDTVAAIWRERGTYTSARSTSLLKIQVSNDSNTVLFDSTCVSVAIFR